MHNRYETIYTINNEHKVYLVKNIQDGSLGVKKELSYYDLSVYEYLKNNRFSGVPEVIDFYEEDQKLIVIEEYIDGLSVEELLERDGCLPADKVKDIALQLCSILAGLNRSKAIVHRDIKPSNIILKNEQVYLIDFNTAKFVTNGNRDTVLLGTEGYAAPEQYGFGSSSVQSDIYAIGVLMQEMCTGQIGQSVKVPGEMGTITEKCLKMDPKDRYQSYEELTGALKGKQFSVLLKKYAPAGFRNENLIVRMIIICWYVFIAYIGVTMTMTGENGPVSPSQLLVFKTGIVLSLLFITQFTFDYRNCQQFLKKRPLWLKALMIVAIDYLILFLGILIPAVIAALI